MIEMTLIKSSPEVRKDCAPASRTIRGSTCVLAVAAEMATLVRGCGGECGWYYGGGCSGEVVQCEV